ncbi:4'-phosphopantetheinyl transferase superfamily protein [Bacteroides ovatus]|nr:4'-phosphopantetheinyl transferase superfamily protein [Bacteroides ovatus]
MLFDIVGSISHKDAIAVAAVGKKKRYKGIGVDIEDQTTILSKKEYSLFCTPQEIACIDKKEFSPIDIFSRKEAILKAYYTAYSKLCNWIDIDTINVSKASNVTIICMLKKNFIINLCCVEK